MQDKAISKKKKDTAKIKSYDELLEYCRVTVKEKVNEILELNMPIINSVRFDTSNDLICTGEYAAKSQRKPTYRH